MKKPDKLTAAFGAIVLACVVVVGAFSVSAAGGDQDDPLVTLSYLTQVVTPELLDKVDEQVEANERALMERLDAAIDAYAEELEQTQSQGTVKSAAYTVVSLEAGQTLLPEAGSELLPRSGESAVTAGTSPVLLDTTDGSVLGTGGILKANHLYVAPLEGAAITASSTGVFLVRGGYSVV